MARASKATCDESVEVGATRNSAGEENVDGDHDAVVRRLLRYCGIEQAGGLLNPRPGQWIGPLARMGFRRLLLRGYGSRG